MDQGKFPLSLLTYLRLQWIPLVPINQMERPCYCKVCRTQTGVLLIAKPISYMLLGNLYLQQQSYRALPHHLLAKDRKIPHLSHLFYLSRVKAHSKEDGLHRSILL